MKQIKRSTFCDALEKRKNGIFKGVFKKLSEKARNISGNRKAKCAVKLHLNLDIQSEMGSGIIFQVDKAAFEYKEFLGDKHERGIQPDYDKLTIWQTN